MENLNIAKSFSLPVVELINGQWNHKYSFHKNLPFYFKLDDQFKMMQKLKHELKNNTSLSDHISLQLSSIQELKKVKIWLKSDESILNLTLFDIYQGMVKHLRDGSYEEQLFNSNDISFVGPLGPFSPMSLVEVLNDDLLEKFIFIEVLKNRLPARRFRLHTDGKVKLKCAEDLEMSAIVHLKQITHSGLIFSTKQDLLLQYLEQGEIVKFFIDTRNIHQINQNGFHADKKIDEFFYTEDELRYFYIESNRIIKTLSYKSSFNNEIYLYCRYHDMLESDVPRIFEQFVNHSSQELLSFFEK